MAMSIKRQLGAGVMTQREKADLAKVLEDLLTIVKVATPADLQAKALRPTGRVQ